MVSRRETYGVMDDWSGSKGDRSMSYSVGCRCLGSRFLLALASCVGGKAQRRVLSTYAGHTEKRPFGQQIPVAGMRAHATSECLAVRNRVSSAFPGQVDGFNAR